MLQPQLGLGLTVCVIQIEWTNISVFFSDFSLGSERKTEDIRTRSRHSSFRREIFLLFFSRIFYIAISKVKKLAGVLASQEKSGFKIFLVKSQESQEIELFFRKSQEKSGLILKSFANFWKLLDFFWYPYHHLCFKMEMKARVAFWCYQQSSSIYSTTKIFFTDEVQNQFYIQHQFLYIEPVLYMLDVVLYIEAVLYQEVVQ